MVTAESVKGKIQGLISQANGVTGKTDSDLTTVIGSLITGFGQGGGSGGTGGSLLQVTLATPFAVPTVAGKVFRSISGTDFAMVIFNGEEPANSQLMFAIVSKDEPVRGWGGICACTRFRDGVYDPINEVSDAYDVVGNVGDSYLIMGGNVP